MYRESGACARGECASGACARGACARGADSVRGSGGGDRGRSGSRPRHTCGRRSPTRVEVAVVPAVRVQERVRLRSLQGEPRLEGDPAGRHVADGVLEFEAVEADLVERPAGQRGDGARGDTGAPRRGQDPVRDLGQSFVQDRDRSPVRPTTSPVSAVARAQLALCSPSQASLHSSIQPRARPRTPRPARASAGIGRVAERRVHGGHVVVPRGPQDEAALGLDGGLRAASERAGGQDLRNRDRHGPHPAPGRPPPSVVPGDRRPPVGWAAMRRKRRIPPSPLPQRDGIDALRVMLPPDGAWSDRARPSGRAVGSRPVPR